jgi:hypothetical protein
LASLVCLDASYPAIGRREVIIRHPEFLLFVLGFTSPASPSTISRRSPPNSTHDPGSLFFTMNSEIRKSQSQRDGKSKYVSNTKRMESRHLQRRPRRQQVDNLEENLSKVKKRNKGHEEYNHNPGKILTRHARYCSMSNQDNGYTVQDAVATTNSSDDRKSARKRRRKGKRKPQMQKTHHAKPSETYLRGYQSACLPKSRLWKIGEQNRARQIANSEPDPGKEFWDLYYNPANEKEWAVPQF